MFSLHKLQFNKSATNQFDLGHYLSVEIPHVAIGDILLRVFAFFFFIEDKSK